jgi:glutathione S-transferase
VREATATFRKFAAVLDEHLGGRRWLLGERLTVADFAVASTLPYAAAARMPLNEFPLVAGWHDRLNELPGWREPFPSARREAA